jgi:formate C-acetyltransferase
MRRLKRAIMPNGGLRMVESGLEAYGFKADPLVSEIWTKYRKHHNAGVFDVYSKEILACRKSGILTGLPDAYGRGRIIGDYRRVALYGVDALIAFKKKEFAELDGRDFSEDVIRLREELSEISARALAELKEMAAKYGYDISRPASNAREAVQWTYFATSPRSRNRTAPPCRSAASPPSSTSTSSATLQAGLITEEQAQEMIDDLVIKLRIVRFLRTPDYDQLFSGDPTWVTESIGGMGEDGRSLVSKSELPHSQHAVQPRPGPGTQPHRAVVGEPAAGLQGLLRQGVDRHLLGAVRERRPDAPVLG